MNSKDEQTNFKRILAVVVLTFMLLLSHSYTLESGNADDVGIAYKSVISITSSGDVEGSNRIQRHGNVYTLKSDLSGSVKDGSIFINIDCDNIIFDGAGKTILGTGGGIAIGVYGNSNITIKNIRVVNFGTGIELHEYFSNSPTYQELTASNNQVIDSYFETSIGLFHLEV